ncbi:hypothetical protein GF420_15335 [candidate division GN15 bacterium]|nr:hypothetical protein [candidate division GN15 bacterium]
MIRVVFTGDMSLTGAFGAAVDQDREIFDDDILELFGRQDFVVTNFEGPATDRSTVSRDDIRVVSPPAAVRYLTDRNVGVFNLANNHVFDCGIHGFHDTRRLIHEAGGVHFGAGDTIAEATRLHLLEGNNMRIALIGVCHREGMIAGEECAGVFCADAEESVEEALDEARTCADWVVLNYHGGEEFTTVPMPSRRRLLRSYLACGADLVIAHHAHTPQGFERDGHRTVFYSLGNCVFDLPSHQSRRHTGVGYLVAACFDEREIITEVIPIEIDAANAHVSMATEEAARFVHALSPPEPYERRWLRDAERVFQQAVAIRANGGVDAPEVNPSNGGSYWRTLLGHLQRPNNRAIAIGAMKARLLRLLGALHD